ncbi:MAG: alpha/beta hydrolase [Verrucomicrobia bacterium]|nr:alpha/beta hydrolase [Verrucomicrobiota bacterium]
MYQNSNLKPSFVKFLAKLSSAPSRPTDFSVAERRKLALERSYVPEEQQEKVGRIYKRAISTLHGTVPLTLFVPEGEGPFPILLYFHGGGFVFGSTQSSAPFCRKLARRTPCLVVSVDYHLSPEFPYPAAVDDAYAALQWAAKHGGEYGGDITQIGVCGESAGGTLAMVTCLRARDERGPTIAYQALFYPVASFELKDAPPVLDQHYLTPEGLRWCRDHYLSHVSQAKEPNCSPLLADDLTRLPRALVVVAQHDCLTAQALEYAQRLEQVEILFCEGMIHNFLQFPFDVEGREEIIDAICSFCRTRFI